MPSFNINQFHVIHDSSLRVWSWWSRVKLFHIKSL